MEEGEEVDGELEEVDGELEVGGLGEGCSGSPPPCGDAVGGVEAEEVDGQVADKSCDIR